MTKLRWDRESKVQRVHGLHATRLAGAWLNYFTYRCDNALLRIFEVQV